MWDKLSARACVVSQKLSESRLPTLGTGAHALASPFPYGLGVYSISPSGERTPLPLYFVSEAAASSRPAGVKPGWYLVATPGTQFELRLTAVQPVFPSLRGRRLPKGFTVDAHLSVDGVHVSKNRINASCEEIVASGFVESMSFADGCVEGTQTIRRFTMQKTAVTEPSKTDPKRERGCIVVRMLSGKLVSMATSEWIEKNARHEVEGKVSEKQAEKLGNSVQVAGGGETVTKALSRQQNHLRYPRDETSFRLFLRERRWLEARHIVTSDGSAWTPISAVVDLADEAGPLEGAAALREFLLDAPLARYRPEMGEGMGKRKGEFSDVEEDEGLEGDGGGKGKIGKVRRVNRQLKFD